MNRNKTADTTREIYTRNENISMLLFLLHELENGNKDVVNGPCGNKLWEKANLKNPPVTKRSMQSMRDHMRRHLMKDLPDPLTSCNLRKYIKSTYGQDVLKGKKPNYVVDEESSNSNDSVQDVLEQASKTNVSGNRTNPDIENFKNDDEERVPRITRSNGILGKRPTSSPVSSRSKWARLRLNDDDSSSESTDDDQDATGNDEAASNGGHVDLDQNHAGRIGDDQIPNNQNAADIQDMNIANIGHIQDGVQTNGQQIENAMQLEDVDDDRNDNDNIDIDLPAAIGENDQLVSSDEEEIESAPGGSSQRHPFWRRFVATTANVEDHQVFDKKLRYLDRVARKYDVEWPQLKDIILQLNEEQANVDMMSVELTLWKKRVKKDKKNAENGNASED